MSPVFLSAMRTSMSARKQRNTCDRKLVDHKDHDVFMINGSGSNVRYQNGSVKFSVLQGRDMGSGW
ncbi:MAG: hypothetical protein A2V87_04780 [Deltaproteobacteria bacterium RBG_16_58_17]|nr:MAG: hypothetical protein A2V87_04780 [Deltaproteobacteria bacterium RBG_16_58_17]